MAKILGHPVLKEIHPYKPRCRRRGIHKTHRGQCRVFCYRIIDITQLTSSKSNSLLDELSANNFDDSVGVYFYRWADDNEPFIKIGECSNRHITAQIQKDWFAIGARSHKTKPLYQELKTVSPTDPAYFVFYEMVTEVATPKVDEYVALGHHRKRFGRLTICRASLPRYGIGASLVWHNPAFGEVLKRQFPNRMYYP